MRCTFDHILPLVIRAERNAPGDFLEAGVWWGQTLIPMARFLEPSYRRVIGFDSFEGMDTPDEKDIDENGKPQYGAGSLRSEYQWVRDSLPKSAELHKGWVPEVFRHFPADRPIAFFHADLDQYLPTLHAMNWAWERMAPGGILACHDWFPNRTGLSSGAIKQFIRETGATLLPVQTPSNHAVFEKP